MKAYSYNNDFNEYQEEVEAYLDVKATEATGINVYALPRKATFIQPPQAIPIDKTIIFENDTWVLISDFRGRLAYNATSIFTINYLGDLKQGDVLLTSEQIEGLNNGTLIYKNGQIIPKPTPTIEEQLKEKEIQYNMSRWQHEYIVANSSLFPEFVVDRAQELEDLAEELRRQNENI